MTLDFTITEHHITDPDTWPQERYPVPTGMPTWALITPHGEETTHPTRDAAWDAFRATVDAPGARMCLDEELGAFVVEVPDPDATGEHRRTGFEITLSVDTVWGTWGEGEECLLTSPTPLSALTAEEMLLVVGQLRLEHSIWWDADREQHPDDGHTPACHGSRTAARCERPRPCDRRIVKAYHLVPEGVLRKRVAVGVLRANPQVRRDPDARWICLACAEPQQPSDQPFTDRQVADYRGYISRACQSCEKPFPTVEEPATPPATTGPAH